MRYTHTSAGTGNFEPLPIGKYSAIVSKVEKKVGLKSDYLAVTFDIQEPGYEERKVWYNAAFDTSFLDQLLIALGYEVIEGEEIEFDTEDSNWINPVILSIGHKIYEGKTQETVQSIATGITPETYTPTHDKPPLKSKNGKSSSKSNKKKNNGVPF